MNFPQALGAYKKSIDRELEQYFDRAIRDAQKKDALIADALKQTKTIALAGGKRIRGALICTAYFGFGGKEKKKIIKVATAIEIFHLFLLVHDDIIDRGSLRHGQTTIQKFFAKKFPNKNDSTEAQHYGNSMAIIVGDTLNALAQQIILEAGFNLENTQKALIEVQKILANTIIGQTQDISISFGNNADESQVLSMYENKTAKYTIEGPLRIGAILAGCDDKKVFKTLNSFAVPLGIAFQIQDDILSLFGNESSIGKSAASDIEEGKKTLLVVKSIEFLAKKNRDVFEKILGKKSLKTTEIKEFQQLIIDCGSLNYCQKLTEKYFTIGKKEIEKLIMLTEQKDFLVGLIEYLEHRKV